MPGRYLLLALLSAFCFGWGANGSSGAQAPLANVVSIQSFSYNAGHAFKAGDTVAARLRGTPAGRAAFAIPGVIESVPMKEVSPGDYTGVYTVPKEISVVGGAVVGWLSCAGIASPLVSAETPITLDSMPPSVISESPSDGVKAAIARPWISASLIDAGGVGVDPAKVRLALDEADVTASATVTPFSIGFAPKEVLATGLHHAAVTVADRLGNARVVRWSFAVAANPPVKSFAMSGAVGAAAHVNQTVRFALQAQPGGKGAVNVGAMAAAIPLGEGAPGVYTGEWTIPRGDGKGAAPVWADFKSRDGARYYVPLSAPLSVDAGTPRPPRITDPETNDIVAGDSLSLAGTALPRATVLVTVRYASDGLGGVLPFKGVASAALAIADDKGRWKIDRVSLKMTSLFVKGQNTVFTLAAVMVAPNGDASSETALTARPEAK